MNIGFNVASMTPGASGGHECYVRNIIRCLADIDNTNKYVLVTGPMNYKTFERPGPNWKVYLHEGRENTPLAYFYSDPNGLPSVKNKHLEYLRRIYARGRGHIRSRTTPLWRDDLSRLIEQEDLDIWFCPLIYTLPMDIDVAVVHTVPDLQHEYYPELFAEDELRSRAAGYQYSCKAATATLATSETTARDLSEIYNVNAKKIFITPLSVDPSFFVGSDALRELAKKAKDKYGLEGDYIYYPANGWPHKNHETLVEALHYCRKDGLDLTLVLTGTAFDVMERIGNIIDRYDCRDYVRHLGHVDSQDVIGLYGGAKALVFPSLFEGFGIPLLEAMALGTPVACSDVTSLPEVGGDAPVYFDPKDAQSVADSIARVLCDDNLRTRMINSGKNRVKAFSYVRTARETLDIFKRITHKRIDKPQIARPMGLSSDNTIIGGHARWYFHCRDLKKLTIRLVRDTDKTGIGHQKVTVSLNDEVRRQGHLEPKGEYRFVLTPERPAPGGFYRLDIRVFLNHSNKRDHVVIRVLCVELEDTSGGTLHLLCTSGH